MAAPVFFHCFSSKTCLFRYENRKKAAFAVNRAEWAALFSPFSHAFFQIWDAAQKKCAIISFAALMTVGQYALVQGGNKHFVNAVSPCGQKPGISLRGQDEKKQKRQGKDA